MKVKIAIGNGKGEFFMHYEKIANRGEQALLQHNSRALSKHTNENIDVNRSRYNKNLTALFNQQDNRTGMQRLQDRLNECTYRKQKNNIRMCEIVITAPKNVRQEDLGRFFKTAYRALQELTGGRENEVAAWLHLDEKTPHLHYDFCPAVEVNGVLKLSAKNLITRERLKELHPEVQRAIDREFGHHNYKVVCDEAADRAQHSDTIKAYKAKQDKIDRLNKTVSKLSAECKAINDNINLAEQQGMQELDAIKQSISKSRELLQLATERQQQAAREWGKFEAEHKEKIEDLETFQAATEMYAPEFAMVIKDCMAYYGPNLNEWPDYEQAVAETQEEYGEPDFDFDEPEL